MRASDVLQASGLVKLIARGQSIENAGPFGILATETTFFTRSTCKPNVRYGWKADVRKRLPRQRAGEVFYATGDIGLA